MTFTEALNLIEAEIGLLKLKDNQGKLLTFEEACGRIGYAIGERYDTVIDDLDQGKISIEEYCERFIDIVKSYREYSAAAEISEILLTKTGEPNVN